MTRVLLAFFFVITPVLAAENPCYQVLVDGRDRSAYQYVNGRFWSLPILPGQKTRLWKTSVWRIQRLERRKRLPGSIPAISFLDARGEVCAFSIFLQVRP